MNKYEIVDAENGYVTLYIHRDNDVLITIENITEASALEYIKLF